MRDFLPGEGAYGFAFTNARISDEIVLGVFFLEINMRIITSGGTEVINPFRFCSAPIDITTYGYSNQGVLITKTWAGGGELLEISTITETTTLQANGVTVRMSGIDNAILTEALSNIIYPNSICNVLYAPYQIKVQENITTGSSGISVTDDANPPLFFSGLLDTMQVVDSGSSATITLNLESKLSTFDRSKPNRFTYENQKNRSTAGYIYSVIDKDHALSHVTEVQRKVLKWGT